MMMVESSISINLPEGKDQEKWPEDTIKQAEEQETGGSELTDVSLSTLKDNHRALVILVLHTLYTFFENELNYHPLQLLVSGTAGTGKSYVTKCLQKLVRLASRLTLAGGQKIAGVYKQTFTGRVG